jgi:HlyD family secretion protein
MVGATAERRAVRVGAIGLDAVELKSGVAVGDELVISGSELFADRDRVGVAD